MTASEAVRVALDIGKKRQADLANLWGTSPQVVNNKFRLKRWNATELAQVAAFTGGRLAFVYPDGQQVFIDDPGEKTEEK